MAYLMPGTQRSCLPDANLAHGSTPPNMLLGVSAVPQGTFPG